MNQISRLILLLVICPSLYAGQYLQDFSSATDGATDLSDGSQISGTIAHVTDVTFKELQLSAQGIGSTHSSFLLPDLDSGQPIQAFSAKWNACVQGDFPNNAADGFSFNFGQIGGLSLTNSIYFQESGFGTGLSFDVQTYSGNNPGFYIRVNGNIIASAPYSPGLEWGTNNPIRHYFEVDWNNYTGMTVRMDNQTIFTNVLTPQFTPASGDRFAWAARCGAYSEYLWLDNIIVMTGGNLIQLPASAPYYGSTDFNSFYPKSLAFDGNDNTTWFPQTAGSGIIGASYPSSPSAVAVCAVTTVNSTDRSADPFNVEVDGSYDGASWGSRGTNQLRYRAGKETRAFALSNRSSAFNDWRLNVQSTFGNATPGVAELRVYRFASSSAVLPWKTTPAPSANYGPIAASSDLRVIAATTGNGSGPFNISTNYGQTWFTGDLPGNPWDCVAVSADGTKMAAGSYTFDNLGGIVDQELWVSGNSGVNWTNTHNSRAWGGLAMSPDGNTIIGACVHQEGIVISTNFGKTFTGLGANTYEIWSSVATSSDTKTMIACGRFWVLGEYNQSHGVYVSTNSGANWTQTSLPFSGATWPQVACSADGKTMAAAGNDGVYISHDSGATWPDVLGGGWYGAGVAMSADGKRMIAGANSGSLFASSDSGVNWQIVPSSGNSWINMVSSTDGRRMAATDNGTVWLSYLPSLTLTRTSNTNLLFWTTNQIGFLLQQTTNLATGSWQLMSTTNASSVTNSGGSYQLGITNDAPAKFFRLMGP